MSWRQRNAKFVVKLKFERFLEFNFLVSAKFCTISFIHEWNLSAKFVVKVKYEIFFELNLLVSAR